MSNHPTQAPAATEAPSYHCVGYIEHYGTEIRDLPKGKQCVPVFVRASDAPAAVGASVQPVQASLSDEQIVRSLVSSRSERQQRIAIKDMASGGEMVVTLEDLRAIAALASSTPTKVGQTS